MIYAYVARTDSEADYWWKENLAVVPAIETIKIARNPIRMIELKNGDKHYFMDHITYSKWCKGRTYSIGDAVYHSNHLIETKGAR